MATRNRGRSPLGYPSPPCNGWGAPCAPCPMDSRSTRTSTSCSQLVGEMRTLYVHTLPWLGDRKVWQRKFTLLLTLKTRRHPCLPTLTSVDCCQSVLELLRTAEG